MIRHNDITIDSQARTIRHGDKTIRFANWRRSAKNKAVRFLLFKYLILGYHDIVELFDLLYGDREDGGPDEGPHVVWLLLHYARPNIRALGFRLIWRKNGRCHKQYHLEPVSEAQ